MPPPMPHSQPFSNRKNSLAWHLLVRFWLCLLLFLLIAGAVQYQALNYFLVRSEAENLRAQLSAFGSDQLAGWFRGQEPFPKFAPDLGAGVTVAFFSPEKKTLALVGRQEAKPQLGGGDPARTLFARAMQKAKPNTRYILRAANGNRYLVWVEPVYSLAAPNSGNLAQRTARGLSSPGQLLGYAAIASSLTAIDNTLANQRRVLLVCAVLILALGGIASFYVLRGPLRPLLKMSDISAKIARGEYSLRIPPEPAAAEIEHLSQALNKMLDTLEASLATEKEAKDRMARFIADASHELRTPLTSIRGFLEILLRSRPTDQETIHNAHQAMLSETERLIQLTEDLLTLNRIATTGSELKPAQTPIQQFLPELMPLLLSLVGKRSFDVDAEPVILPIEPNELKQILFNLLQNAAQHTPANGRIALTFRATVGMPAANAETSPTLKPGVLLTVSDNGEGIAVEDLPHIFERFYRGNRSRSHERGQGSGLGLAIVRDIVTLRNGRIDVQSKPGEGTAFTIFFPVF